VNKVSRGLIKSNGFDLRIGLLSIVRNNLKTWPVLQGQKILFDIRLKRLLVYRQLFLSDYGHPFFNPTHLIEGFQIYSIVYCYLQVVV
jgi:hypothetical protein